MQKRAAATKGRTPTVTMRKQEKDAGGGDGGVSAGCKADLEGALGRHHVVALAPETAAATRLEEATNIDDDIHPRRRTAARSLNTQDTYTMALRQAVGRPLGQAVRSASCSRPAVRTFAATALRAKEVAGDSSDAANLRVCRPWFCRVCCRC